MRIGGHLSFILLDFGLLSAARADSSAPDHIVLSLDRKVLHPVRENEGTANLTLTVFRSDGSRL